MRRDFQRQHIDPRARPDWMTDEFNREADQQIRQLKRKLQLICGAQERITPSLIPQEYEKRILGEIKVQPEFVESLVNIHGLKSVFQRRSDATRDIANLAHARVFNVNLSDLPTEVVENRLSVEERQLLSVVRDINERIVQADKIIVLNNDLMTQLANITQQNPIQNAASLNALITERIGAQSPRVDVMASQDKRNEYRELLQSQVVNLSTEKTTLTDSLPVPNQRITTFIQNVRDFKARRAEDIQLQNKIDFLEARKRDALAAKEDKAQVQRNQALSKLRARVNKSAVN